MDKIVHIDFDLGGWDLLDYFHTALAAVPLSIIALSSLLLVIRFSRLSRLPAVRARLDRKIIIEPIDVPDELKAQGLTPIVVARRLVDAMRQIEQDVRNGAQSGSGIELMIADSALPDIAVPPVGLSVRSIVLWIRRFADLPQRRLSGEITKIQGRYAIKLRASGTQIETYPLDLETPDALSDLLASASVAAMAEIAPTVMARYFLWQGLSEEAGQVLFGAIHRLHSRRSYRKEYLLCLRLIGVMRASKLKLHGFEGFPKERQAVELKEIERLFQEIHARIQDELTHHLAYRLVPAHWLWPVAFSGLYNTWGNALTQLNRYEEGIEKYCHATDIDPKNTVAIYNWGLALYKLKRPDEAIERFRRAIEINPNYALAFLIWGRVLADCNRGDEAIEKFRRAVEINPNYAAAFLSWGSVLQSLGRVGEAKEMFERARVLRRRGIEIRRKSGIKPLDPRRRTDEPGPQRPRNVAPPSPTAGPGTHA